MDQELDTKGNGKEPRGDLISFNRPWDDAERKGSNITL